MLLGQSGFERVHLRNPFAYLPELVERIKERTRTIIVDFHAATTAEKYTMFYHADGLVSAVIGTHSRVMTADEALQPGGTAVICDVGRTGSLNSVGGLDSKIEIGKFLTRVPERSKEAWDNLELQGVIVDINDQGKAEHIERLRMPCPEVSNDRESNSTTHK